MAPYMSTFGWQGRCFRPNEIAWVKEWAAQLVAAVESLEVNGAFLKRCISIIYLDSETIKAGFVGI